VEAMLTLVLQLVEIVVMNRYCIEKLMDEALECITSLLNPEANNRLLRPVSEEEVHRAVIQMHPNKSPGLDGLGTGFFQHFWDIVGSDVAMFCRKFVDIVSCQHEPMTHL